MWKQVFCAQDKNTMDYSFERFSFLIYLKPDSERLCIYYVACGSSAKINSEITTCKLYIFCYSVCRPMNSQQAIQAGQLLPKLHLIPGTRNVKIHDLVPFDCIKQASELLGSYLGLIICRLSFTYVTKFCNVLTLLVENQFLVVIETPLRQNPPQGLEQLISIHSALTVSFLGEVFFSTPGNKKYKIVANTNLQIK